MIGHIRAMAWRILFLSVLFGVSACVGPPRGRAPDPKPRPPAVATSADTRQCLGDLAKINARFTPIPDQNFGSGCTTVGSVQLLGAGVPITNIKAIRCPLARALTVWAREALQLAARDTLGSSVVQIESMGAYSCRNIIGGRGTGRSEHATGNAVDIGGFVLADGRRISLRQGWNGTDDERAFLRQIRASACKHFQTVLSPDYNAAHYDHLHFDLGGKPFCR
jgi:hypothetical protein